MSSPHRCLVCQGRNQVLRARVSVSTRSLLCKSKLGELPIVVLPHLVFGCEIRVFGIQAFLPLSSHTLVVRQAALARFNGVESERGGQGLGIRADSRWTPRPVGRCCHRRQPFRVFVLLRHGILRHRQSAGHVLLRLWLRTTRNGRR